jgi:predicted dehydrogenase
MVKERIRFAVVGLGNIAQVAVLPGFKNARETCELAALVSSNGEKLRELSEHYKVEHAGSYDDLERILQNAKIDAAYLALPTRSIEYLPSAARARAFMCCAKSRWR